MRTAKAMVLAAALLLPAPAANAGGWHYGYRGGCGSGFWAGVGVVGGLIGLGILADALTRPDVVYVTQPPAASYDFPPPAPREPAHDAETRERDAYLAGWTAGRADAWDDAPYYPTAPVHR